MLAEPVFHSLRTTSERLDYIARSYSSGYAEGNTSGIAHVYENRLSYGLSDPERDERIQEAVNSDTPSGKRPVGRKPSRLPKPIFLLRVCIWLNIRGSGSNPYTSGWYHQPGAGWLWTDKFTFPFSFFHLWRQGNRLALL